MPDIYRVEGVPFQRVLAQSPPAIAAQGQATLGGTQVILTPSIPNYNLRKLIITLSQDAAILADGTQTMNIALNPAGSVVTIYIDNIKMYALPSVIIPYRFEMDFTSTGLNLGSGPLTITLGKPLTGGQMSANGFFINPNY